MSGHTGMARKWLRLISIHVAIVGILVSMAIPAFANGLSTISGTLTDQTGAAVGGARVTISGSNGLSASGETASDGTYNFSAEAGVYDYGITINFPYRAYQGWPDSFDVTWDEPVIVSPGLNNYHYIISMVKLSISTTNPEGGNELQSIVGSSSQFGSNSLTVNGDNQNVQISNLAFSTSGQGAEDYSQTFWVPDGTRFGLTSGITADTIRATVTGQTLRLREPLTVNGDTNVHFVAKPVNTFSGSLRDQSGRAISGATIILNSTDGDITNGRVAEDGSFSFSAAQVLYDDFIDIIFPQSLYTGWPSSLEITSPIQYDLRTGDMQKDIVIDMVPLTIKSLNSNSEIIPSTIRGSSERSSILMDVNGASTAATSSNLDFFSGSDMEHTVWVPNGTYFGLVNGEDMTYDSIWDEASGYRLPEPMLVSGATSISLRPKQIQVPAPILEGRLVAGKALLRWNPVDAVTGYLVYRDGELIDTVPNEPSLRQSYDDAAVPGAHTYYVISVGDNGELSQQSNVLNFEIVANGPPIIEITDESLGLPTQVGSEYILHGTFVDNESYDWTAVIDYGDGSGANNLEFSEFQDYHKFSSSHIYTQAGIYEVSVTITDNQGQVGSARVTAVVHDVSSEPPVVTGSFDRTPDNGQWYNNDVTITWSASDPDSTATTPSPTVVSTEGANQNITSELSCDPSGNCATGAVTVNLDKTAPVITASLSEQPNNEGWNNGPVTVTFACDDAISGVATCSEPVLVSAEGGSIITGTAIDNAGNTTSLNVFVSIDSTKPTIEYVADPVLSADGWSTGDVTVTFTCTDNANANQSGIASCSSPVTVSADGEQNVIGTAVDIAGNIQTITVPVRLDKTAPTIGYTLNPAPNTQGWNNSPVTVTFVCDDVLSGMAACTAPQTITSDGAYIVTGVARDAAGNESAINVTVGIDSVAPVVADATLTNSYIVKGGTSTLTAPVSDANPSSGVAAAEYFVGTTDPGLGNGTPVSVNAGVMSQTFDSTNLTNTTGAYAINYRSKDAAGNWSELKTVILTVYDATTTFGLTGSPKKNEFVPGSIPGSGDALPGLNGTKAGDYGISVEYKNGVVLAKKPFSFTYNNNWHDVVFTSTAIDWFTTGGTNNSQAWFQGTGTLVVDGGQPKTNAFWVTVVDGTRRTPAEDNYIQIKVFAPGADPATASPLYQATSIVTSNNSINIK